MRLDEESKAVLMSAAELRKVSVSNYVRSIVVPLVHSKESPDSDVTFAHVARIILGKTRNEHF